MKQRQIRLPEPLDEWLQREANKKGLSLAEVVRRILDDVQTGRVIASPKMPAKQTKVKAK